MLSYQYNTADDSGLGSMKQCFNIPFYFSGNTFVWEKSPAKIPFFSLHSEQIYMSNLLWVTKFVEYFIALVTISNIYFHSMQYNEIQCNTISDIRVNVILEWAGSTSFFFAANFLILLLTFLLLLSRRRGGMPEKEQQYWLHWSTKCIKDAFN